MGKYASSVATIILVCVGVAISQISDDRTGLEIPSLTPDVQVIVRSGYTLGYSPEYKQAKWVAYELTRAESEELVVRSRKNFFKADSDVPNPVSSKSFSSTYDRGHIAPAADFRWSKKAYQESFLMTNMSPQRKELNRGIWKKLEAMVREWSIQDESLFIVSGPALEPGLKSLPNGMAIPRYYYKVILDDTDPGIKAIGFVFENKGSKKPLSAFAVTVDSVESLTGLDFFYKLPDDIEDTLERHMNIEDWGLR